MIRIALLGGAIMVVVTFETLIGFNSFGDWASQLINTAMNNGVQ